MTLLMASLVGIHGRIVGTDSDSEILALARQDAEVAQLGNVEFRHTDVAVCQEEEGVDLVYARFLLTHLSEPEKCLEAMKKACKPKGVIEDIDFSGSFCHPYCAAYEMYLELYKETAHRRVVDPNIGPKLARMLRQAGAQAIQVNIVQAAHLEGEVKLIASVTMERIADSVISEGLARQKEVKEIIHGLNEAAADTAILMSLPRAFQTWGGRT